MKKIVPLFTILVALWSFLAPWCQASQAKETTQQEFLLFYSNDVKGETGPCG